MYKIIRQKRKSISLLIDEELNVIIKAPYYVSKKQIEEILEKNKLWAEQTISRKRERKIQNDWIANKKVFYLGEYRKLCILKAINGNTRVEYKNNVFSFYINDLQDKETIRLLLEGYMKQEAEILFENLTKKYTNLIEKNYNKITIRKQKTRWGSCSSKGNLSYNVKLMGAPLECIEYVVLHEVMHLRHFNHSEIFWQDIKKIMPDYRERKIYLKEYGQNFEI